MRFRLRFPLLVLVLLIANAFLAARPARAAKEQPSTICIYHQDPDGSLHPYCAYWPLTTCDEGCRL